jgi:hypothetical protein
MSKDCTAFVFRAEVSYVGTGVPQYLSTRLYGITFNSHCCENYRAHSSEHREKSGVVMSVPIFPRAFVARLSELLIWMELLPHSHTTDVPQTPVENECQGANIAMGTECSAFLVWKWSSSRHRKSRNSRALSHDVPQLRDFIFISWSRNLFLFSDIYKEAPFLKKATRSNQFHCCVLRQLLLSSFRLEVTPCFLSGWDVTRCSLVRRYTIHTTGPSAWRCQLVE